MKIFISLSASEYSGKKLAVEANEGRFFPKGVEGYWRSTIKGKDKLPFPVAFKPKGYDKGEFLLALSKMQKRATLRKDKGFSRHRWDKSPNKSGEYSLAGWKWPEGYITYIEQGVPPSRAFYNRVMKEDLTSLLDLHEGE